MLPIAHDSGGPRADIVRAGETGYLATTAEQYARHIRDVLDGDRTALARMQAAARESAKRFSDAVFDEALGRQLEANVAALVHS